LGAPLGALLLSVEITSESDVVVVRQRARLAAELIGFENQDQTRIATAISEIARTTIERGSLGQADFCVTAETPPCLVVTIRDQGPPIADLDAVLDGQAGRIGVGFLNARRLVDRFRVSSSAADGTIVEIGKQFSSRQRVPTPRDLTIIATRLARMRPAATPLSALGDQNRELVHSLDALQERQQELMRLGNELEDTNRGVVALYAELDEKAEQLRLASELKTRFLSNASHEFRTPLNSILALSQLLLDRVDGELTGEQTKQIGYIKRSALSLIELVNDLLDIAKVEAGKTDVRPSSFLVTELFAGLRGSLRPLQTRDTVDLAFDDPPADLPTLQTDEAKVTQILRNFISNALKFTERGQVRISAGWDGKRMRFDVSDTGIGIALENQARIFEEFTQIENPLQREAKGTGLGLPLSRRLAELLQGEVLVSSTLGRGSTFSLILPPDFARAPARPQDDPGARRPVVLIVDDEEAFRYALGHMIGGGDRNYDIHEAADGREGLVQARLLHPDAIVLDLQMPQLDGFAVLDELAADPATRDIPVLISTSLNLDATARQRLAAARAFLPKAALSREVVSTALARALAVSS
jgi:signal transduction histidine kinase/CheY-like chemotaxis protein